MEQLRRLALIGLVVGVVQVPLHEGGHYLTCVVFQGTGCRIFYNMAQGKVAPGWQHTLYMFAGAVPALIAASTATLVAVRKSRPILAELAFATALVSVGRPMIALAMYASSPRIRSSGGTDELAAAASMGLPPWTGFVPVIVGLSFAAICSFRLLQLPRLSAAVAAIAGGAGGTALWLGALGPALLPWR